MSVQLCINLFVIHSFIHQIGEFVKVSRPIDHSNLDSDSNYKTG
jgi:hypothetical protein